MNLVPASESWSQQRKPVFDSGADADAGRKEWLSIRFITEASCLPSKAKKQKRQGRKERSSDKSKNQDCEIP
jgi:hypothetical protein